MYQVHTIKAVVASKTLKKLSLFMSAWFRQAIRAASNELVHLFDLLIDLLARAHFADLGSRDRIAVCLGLKAQFASLSSSVTISDPVRIRTSRSLNLSADKTILAKQVLHLNDLESRPSPIRSN